MFIFITIKIILKMMVGDVLIDLYKQFYLGIILKVVSNKIFLLFQKYKKL